MQQLINHYLAGSDTLSRAVAGMTPEQIHARPIPGKWSTLEVVCHLGDSELIFAERMRRVLIEDEPPLRFFDPDWCVTNLAYADRDVGEELELIGVIRRQMARILAARPDDIWQRRGIHNQAGPLTLEQIVRKAVDHLNHHVQTIQEKRTALGL